MDQRYEGSFAVITGASSGIGFELALQFAQHGFDVLVAAEDEGIARAADGLVSYGHRVETLQTDLATYEGVEKLYAKIQTIGRPVDALVLNAGVGLSGPFVQTSLEENLNLIKLNVISVVHLAHRVLQDMTSRGQGRVLVTSSIAGVAPGPFMATYNASKAFEKSFAEAIRNELKDFGITVTVLMPGATETNFFDRAGMQDTKLGASEGKDDPAEVARDGFEALMAGKDHVVAGSFKNKVQAAASHVMPDTVVAQIHRKQSEPGSAHK